MHSEAISRQCCCIDDTSDCRVFTPKETERGGRVWLQIKPSPLCMHMHYISRFELKGCQIQKGVSLHTAEVYGEGHGHKLKSWTSAHVVQFIQR